jgi:hypothetical protein
MPQRDPDKPAPKLDGTEPEGTKNARLRKKSEKVKLLYTPFIALCLPIYTGGHQLSNHAVVRHDSETTYKIL